MPGMATVKWRREADQKTKELWSLDTILPLTSKITMNKSQLC